MHIFFKKGKDIYCCGHNQYGELGFNDTINRLTETKTDLNDIKKIITERNKTFIIKNDNTLWVTGKNTSGELGLGDKTNRLEFTKTDMTDVVDVMVGNGYTFILKSDGTLWASGYNGSAQFGNGSQTSETSFIQLKISDVKSVYCGNSTSLIIKNDNTLWAAGYNYNNQMGLSVKETPIKEFRQLGITDVKKAIASLSHIAVLKNDGTLWSCGKNTNGILGLGDFTDRTTFTQVNIDNIKDIYCTDSVTYIVKNDGTLWGTGSNSYGELGLGHKNKVNMFTQANIDFCVKNIYVASNNTTVLLSEDNKLYEAGYKFTGTEAYTTFTYMGIENVNILFPSEIEALPLLFLIKNNDKLYTIDQNSQLVESSIDEINEKGVDIEIINKTIENIPNPFSIVCNNIDANIKLLGMKQSSVMIVLPVSVDIPIAETIKSITVSKVLDKVHAKIVISVNGGATYYTFENGSFEELDIEIPQGSYESFNDEQKTSWNVAMGKVYMRGIDINDLSSINFNLLMFEKGTLKFKYIIVIDATDAESIVNLKNISLTYQTSN